MTIQRTLNSILNAVNQYPVCISSRAKKFHALQQAARQSYLTIRQQYRDIWIEYIHRPKTRSFGLRFSIELRQRYGDRAREFLRLKDAINAYERDVVGDWDRFTAMLQLMHSTGDDLNAALEFITCANALDVRMEMQGSWVNNVTPEYAAEIMMWRFVKRC